MSAARVPTFRVQWLWGGKSDTIRSRACIFQDFNH